MVSLILTAAENNMQKIVYFYCSSYTGTRYAKKLEVYNQQRMDQQIVTEATIY